MIDRLYNIDVISSIRKKKLIYPKSFFDYLNFCSNLIIFIAIPYILIMVITKESSMENSNDRFFAYYITPVIIVFSFYLLYRSFVEKNLNYIRSTFSAQKNKERLLLYAAEKGYAVFYRSDDLLIFTEESQFDSNRLKVVVCILEKHNVWFTMFRDNGRANIPTITSHIYLAKDLKLLLL